MSSVAIRIAPRAGRQTGTMKAKVRHQLNPTDQLFSLIYEIYFCKSIKILFV
jgi:hypothetical protein